VLSLTGDFVWASWPGTAATVKLGQYSTVKAVMQDFLDQSLIGERLIEQNIRRVSADQPDPFS
jgi:hypothetical protein